MGKTHTNKGFVGVNGICFRTWLSAINDGRQIHLTALIRKGRSTMTQLSQEILVYSRACEHLLSTEVTLNDDESSLVEYYVQELSRKFVSPGPTMQKA